VNYFSHARRFLDDPFFVAAVSVPDWMGVINRRAKAPTKLAVPFAHDQDQRVASIARGIIQHHHDDKWFHQCPAFVELQLSFTARLQTFVSQDRSLRPRFFGHVLIEVLLDDILISENPAQLDRYYEVAAEYDAAFISQTVNRMLTRRTGMLAFFIPLFVKERFLYDYSDDAKLLYRMNRVMKRLRLDPMPTEVATFFPEARALVRSRKSQLLVGENPQLAYENPL